MDAVGKAIQARRPHPGVIHHSDQGGQYVGRDFVRRCRRAGITISMGSVGDCFEDSMAESFFATLECEPVDRYRFHNLTEARHGIISFIGWYNHRRRHTALDVNSPVRYEQTHRAAHAA